MPRSCPALVIIGLCAGLLLPGCVRALDEWGRASDGRTEAAARDASRPTDARSDAWTRDTLDDAYPTSDRRSVPILDATTDPCTSGWEVVLTYAPGMVLCARKGLGGYSQCTAKTACDQLAGWHLCSADEFLARGGATTPAPLSAWMAGCIRDGTGVVPLISAVCSACSTTAVGASETISWPCSSPAPPHQTSNLHVGLVASDHCRRVGVNTQKQEAMWNAGESTLSLTASACCQ